MDNLNRNITMTTKKYHMKQGQKLPNRNSLHCPGCGWHRLIDTSRGTISQTFKPGQPGYDDADYYQKCCKCGKEIGIKKM